MICNFVTEWLSYSVTFSIELNTVDSASTVIESVLTIQHIEVNAERRYSFFSSPPRICSCAVPNQ